MREIYRGHLNSRQKEFVRLVVKGDRPAHRAYSEVYDVKSERAARAASARLLATPIVSERIKELQQASDSLAVMSLEEKRRFLWEVISTPVEDIGPESALCQSYTENTKSGQITVKTLDKLRAIEMDSKLAGHFQAEKHEVEVNPQLLEMVNAVRDGAAQRASRGKESRL